MVVEVRGTLMVFDVGKGRVEKVTFKILIQPEIAEKNTYWLFNTPPRLQEYFFSVLKFRVQN